MSPAWHEQALGLAAHLAPAGSAGAQRPAPPPRPDGGLEQPRTEPGKLARVLVVHNAYQQEGGEDAVAQGETALLRRHGHAVECYTRSNDEVGHVSRPALAAQTLWSPRSYREIGALIGRFRPDVVHVHNTLPLVSPAVYWVAQRSGVPVVQTLHNFRLLCPQGLLLRAGAPCEDCVGRVPWRGVLHRCYRGSAAQSAVVAGMLTLHRGLGTYAHKVTRYIALNEFCRRKFEAGGIPARKLVVKPNFVEPPAFVAPATERRGGLYVGRLSAEKGVRVLAAALGHAPAATVEVVGSGPEAACLQGVRNCRLLGWLESSRVAQLMAQRAYLVMPSVWYENFPRTLVEAFASGLPVIASRIGALAELIEDGETGLLFEPGSAADLARKLDFAQAHPQALRAMGERARAVYAKHYTPAANYRTLKAIYTAAQTESRAGGP